MDNIQDNRFEDSFLPMTSIENGAGISILPDVYCFTNKIVNLCFIGGVNNEFIMVDAGMPKSADIIRKEAVKRFGENACPKAIILTHGHFDHVGSLVPLLEQWKVPVYAHTLELPYLTGKRNYPQADPSVDSGMIAKLSPFFPNHGINIAEHVHKLPEDGTIPNMPGWRWIHTPGHTPGHVSFFREDDRALIAGDAFVTVKQESLYSVLVQEKEISGPPRYFTTDWEDAYQSVRILESLKPTIAITGHGRPMSGFELANGLHHLVEHFKEVAVPKNSRFIN